MPYNEISRANLKPPWSKENPSPSNGGRPRKRPLSEANDDLLRCEVPVDITRALRKWGIKPRATWADILAMALAREGLKGNVPAIKELRESVEGKATQRIELIAHEDRQVDICVTFEQQVPRRNIERIIETEVEGDAATKSDLVEAVVAKVAEETNE